MNNSPLFVAGAGLMGSGIAQSAAARGFRVLLHDIDPDRIGKSREAMRWSAEKLHAKDAQGWPAADEVLGRVEFGAGLGGAAECGLVVEAVAEDAVVKSGLFRELDRVCPPDTLFFTNTSAIPITKLASSTSRPDRFCGVHFFSPVPLMKLVEVTRGLGTADATVARAKEFAGALGKTAVEVRGDPAGFLVNRLLVGMILEAVRLLERGAASAEDIDLAMKLGCGHKMGPLETADMSGLDVFLGAAEAIYADTGDERFHPPPLLRRMVAAGRLGRKSGGGFVTGREQ